MVDDRKLYPFDRIIGRIESERRTEQDAARSQAIARRRQRYRFQTLRQESLLPTVRELAAKLERRGHLTRLRELDGGDRLRFDVQIQGPSPRRGAFHLELLEADEAVEVAYSRGWDELHRQTYPLERVDGPFVMELLLAFVEALAGRP